MDERYTEVDLEELDRQVGREITQDIVMQVLDEFFMRGEPETFQVACNVFGNEAVAQYFEWKGNRG